MQGGLFGNPDAEDPLKRRARISEVYVEIVAKQKACILCDLAIGILEGIAPGMLRWSVADVGARSGLARMEALSRAIREAMQATASPDQGSRLSFRT